MSDSPYQSAGGALKLKGIGHVGKNDKFQKSQYEEAQQDLRKSKKKKKSTKKYLEKISTDPEQITNGSSLKDNRTPAQKAFDRVRDKRQEEKILEKAGKKHKDHVEEFNRKLDQLTEHFDIPKVSWTK